MEQNEKKQIEEMAREIECAKQDIWANVRTRGEDEDYLWHSRAIAEHLTAKGYRKIPDGTSLGEYIAKQLNNVNYIKTISIDGVEVEEK